MALPEKNIKHLPSRKGGKNLNFLEHMHKLGIQRTLFLHIKVIIENLQAHIYKKGPNNSTCSHV